jgi:hypothetical protein
MAKLLRRRGRTAPRIRLRNIGEVKGLEIISIYLWKKSTAKRQTSNLPRTPDPSSSVYDSERDVEREELLDGDC